MTRVLLHVEDGALDEDRLVVGDLHADAGHLAVDPRHLRLDALRHRDGVLARLLVDAHADGGTAVDAQELPAIFGGVVDVGDVAQVDRHAVTRQHDEVADVVEAGELPLAADQIGGVALVDFAERQVLVLGAQRLHDAVDRKVERGDLLLRQLDVDLAAQAAVDVDRGHAGRALEARRQVVLRHLAQRHRVVVAVDREVDDRHRVRVGLEDLWRLGFFRHAAAHAVDAAAHVVGRLGEVGAPAEVEADLAAAFRKTSSSPARGRRRR